MRSGSIFLGFSARTEALPGSRLMAFQFSTDVGYILEFNDRLIRFWTSDGTYLSGSDVTSPYNMNAVFPDVAPNLWEIQGKQINDILYLVHPLYPVQKLTRLTSTTFALAEVAWKYPAFLDENTNGTTTLALGALTGTTTLTANVANTFNANHVGSYWEIRHLRNASSTQIDISGSAGTVTGTAVDVVGDWTVTTTQRWYGVLQLQRSTDGGSTWKVAREFTRKGDGNAVASGTEPTPNVGQNRNQIRLVYTATGDPYGAGVWVGPVPTSYVLATAVLEVSNAYIAGLVKATAFVSGTVLTVTVLLSPVSTAATPIWSEGAWSKFRGYPRAVGMFEQRIFYAGTAYRPNTAWGSVTADFENFQYSDLDDAAVAIQFAAAQQNPIQWLASQTMLNGATAGEEFAIRSGNNDEPLTPANVTVRGGTHYGALYQAALTIGSSVVFVQRQGRRIRELHELSFYVDPGQDNTSDLTLLAEHITGPGITQMAFASLPDPTLYCVRSDGVLAILTYHREQNVIAWARWTTSVGRNDGGTITYPDGLVISVAVLYGTPADKVFLCVQRGNAATTGDALYNIEAFSAETQDKTQGIFADSAYRFFDGSPHSSFEMPDTHFFNAGTVVVVADGQVLVVEYIPLPTSAPVNPCDATWYEEIRSGHVHHSFLTLLNGMTATIVTVGLPYTGILKPMKLDLQISNGTSQGRKRRISEVVARFKESLGCTYGNDTVNDPANGKYAAEIPFRDPTDNMDASPPLFTGDKQLIPWEGGNDLDGDIVISQQQPLPMTVLGLFAKFEVFGS